MVMTMTMTMTMTMFLRPLIPDFYACIISKFSTPPLEFVGFDIRLF